MTQRPSTSLRLAFVLAGAILASGCYRGGAHPTSASALRAGSGWVLLDVPLVLQEGERDCGAAAVSMVLGFWGLPTAQDAIRAASALPKDRALPATFLRTYLRERGLQAFLLEGTLKDLERELRAGRPVLVGVVKPYLKTSVSHYLVVVGLNAALSQLAVLDPADGWRTYTFEAFSAEWAPARSLTLVVSPADKPF